MVVNIHVSYLYIHNIHECHLQTDLEERMAQELAVVYPRHCRGKQNQRVDVPEQHGDPQAALGGGV